MKHSSAHAELKQGVLAQPLGSSQPESPDYYLESGVSPEISQFISERWPSVSAQYASDPVNCTMGSRAWQHAFRQAGIPHQHVAGQFLHPNGPWYHEYLTVGDHDHIFDPTAAQWPIAARPDLYVADLPDSDDEVPWTIADQREEARVDPNLYPDLFDPDPNWSP